MLVQSAPDAISFHQALFEPEDCVSFRPIETWVENGRKKSRVGYRHVLHRRATPADLVDAMSIMEGHAAAEKYNVFVGVCPRFGPDGRFDLAWQIRTVRALWADLDQVSVEEALDRVAKAGLPPPSIVVNSGNGVHLYWLLESPYLIDDVGDPLPVETEWEHSAGGRRKRQYIVQDGERIYIDDRRHASRLSVKAEFAQDILAGIAKAIGGDSTHDLSRLLRVPGTLNRKDERNGKPPVPTALIECDVTRLYALATFERFKSLSPEAERNKKIAAMPLPRTRKLSSSKADRLGELVATCQVAAPGSRSEADFAVCCYAVRNGVARDEVWSLVENLGKFEEQGRRYFDLTWENAEHECRASMFDKVHKRVAEGADGAGDNGNGNSFSNEHDSDERPTIRVDARTMPVGHTLTQVTDRLRAVGNCFIRADQLVVINDQQIRSVLSPPELSGLLNQHVEFYFVDGESGEYKPFPPSHANVWLNQHVQRGRLPAIKLFTRNPVFTEDWRLVASGYDAASGIYYAGPTVEPLDGTHHLDTLLKEFCFKTPGDCTNYLGMLLTAILVPQFIGSKPAVLFNGNQPQLGKSILAQIIASLRDGQPASTCSYNPNDEEFEKSLGATVRSGATTIIIDNAKARGRNPRIESACLERSITDTILSFRLLGHSGLIRAENSHIFCITANAPDVGRDLVTRSVIINLYYEGDPRRRKFAMSDPEAYAVKNRVQLLGELVGMVERWKSAGMPQADVDSRFNKRGWGNIVGGILHTSGKPDFLTNAEEASEILDETRREFGELVAIMADHPQRICTGSDLVMLCKNHGLLTSDLGDGTSRSLSTKMGTLATRFISEPFPLTDGRHAVFHRTPERKGNVYTVTIHA